MTTILTYREKLSSTRKLSSYLRSAQWVYPPTGVDSSNDDTRNLKTNKAGRKLSIGLLPP